MPDIFGWCTDCGNPTNLCNCTSDAGKRRVTSPVWAFYESDHGTEVVARGIMNKEVFTDVHIFPGDIPERGDMIVANSEDFSDKRLVKHEVFTAMFKQIRKDKE